jgi:glycine betaine/proline transport system permease protein
MASLQKVNCLLIGDFPLGQGFGNAVAQAINGVISWLTVNLAWFFDGITWAVRNVLDLLAQIFIGTPWPVTMFVLVLIAWARGGRNVALFVGGALAYIAVFGFWQQAMSTLALVSAATFISIALGLPIGIWCAKRDGAYRIVRPILDVMQTLPSFVYLIPAIAFFSIGKPPAVLATVIFSTPPMIRLTVLGITQVAGSVKEAALAYGATDRQLLWKVELPLAIPSIMTGINQTILLSLSMSVVAALIGAGGLGYDVLFALQNVEPGRGILAGIAIAFCAMIIDRVVQATQPATRS